MLEGRSDDFKNIFTHFQPTQIPKIIRDIPSPESDQQNIDFMNLCRCIRKNNGIIHLHLY